ARELRRYTWSGLHVPGGRRGTRDLGVCWFRLLFVVAVVVVLVLTIILVAAQFLLVSVPAQLTRLPSVVTGQLPKTQVHTSTHHTCFVVIDFSCVLRKDFAQIIPCCIFVPP
ncbi:unnamed protein product, partial [Ectocarpus sp. 4 AP-2014]